MSFFRPNIAAMAGYTPGEQPQRGKSIKLNTNENPYPPSPSVARAVQSVLKQGLTRYPDSMAGAFRLRAAEILGVQPDWILCGNGSDDILTIATRAFVGEGEVLRTAYPSYVLYRHLADIQAAQCEEIHFAADWSLDDRFAAPHDGLRLAVLPNPNSPSGTMISPDRVAQIADALPCPLLVDEAYADFADTNCSSLVATNEKIMVSRSLSKSYGLAGLRFGFVIAQPHVIAGLAKVKDSYNCDALSIAAATAAIDDQGWLEENRRQIIRTRTRMIEQLRALQFDVVDSQANFAWAVSAKTDAKAIYESLKADGVLVRYMDYPDWGDGLRISVGTDEQVDTCLALLKSKL